MMSKNEKRTHILTTIICLIPIIIGALLYPSLPETVVTHWDGNGVPNGWQPKFVGIIVFPGILFLLKLAMPFLLKMDPKYNNMDSKLRLLVHWIIAFISVFASGVTLSSAFGRELPIPTIGTMLMGLMFIAIGNYLPKTKQSFTMGIRLPWTLNSEENWNKTHRLGGFLWVLGGFCILISGIFGFAAKLIIPITLIMVLVPTIYSYLLYKKGI